MLYIFFVIGDKALTFFFIFDQDDDNELDLEEFIHFMESLSCFGNSDVETFSKRVFDVIDKDGNGTIDASEIVRLLKKGSFNITEDKAREWIKKVDTNGDGVLSSDEFIKFFTDVFVQMFD